MPEIDIIKNACIQALDDTKDVRDRTMLFREIVDPASVLELANLVEASITPHDLETLMLLIRNLADYLEAVPDTGNDMTHLDRDDLLRQARYTLSIYAR